MEQRPNFKSSSRMSREEIAEEQAINLMIKKLKQAVSITSEKANNKKTLSSLCENNKQSKKLESIICSKNPKQSSYDQSIEKTICHEFNQDYESWPQGQLYQNVSFDMAQHQQTSQSIQRHKQTIGEIVWNNFILIPNLLSNQKSYTCGVCRHCFSKVDMYICHCIQFCGEIDHPNSSHLIKIKASEHFPNIQKPLAKDLNKIQSLQQAGQIPIIINQKQISVLKCQGQQNLIDLCAESDVHNNVNQQKQIFIGMIKEKQLQIKHYSQRLLAFWQKTHKQFKFIYRKDYAIINSKFIIAINPLEKNITSLNQQSKNCKRKATIHILFLFHFFGKCCPINSPSSIYLILWADDFYKYLYSTNDLPQKTMKSSELDIKYLKYLYENTPYSLQIDSNYPLFKYFLGFIEALNFTQALTNTCKLCGFQGININRIWIISFANISRKQKSKITSEYNKHYRTCTLYDTKQGGFQLHKHYPTMSTPFTYLINIKGIERYTFFCPICANLQKQMTAERLVSHMHKRHDSITAKVLLSNYCKSYYKKHKDYNNRK